MVIKISCFFWVNPERKNARIVNPVSKTIPRMTIIMGRKKDTLKQRKSKMKLKRRYHYNDGTPLIELFKPEYQRFLIVGIIAEELKGLLRNGDMIDIRELSFLEFRLAEYGEDEKTFCLRKHIYHWLAKLLLSIGNDGTRYGKSMIFRYLTDGHSNLYEKELSLKSSVSREFQKIVLTNI
jgi:hypothetical protein